MFSVSKLSTQVNSGVDLASKISGAISVIFGNQVSLRVHYCKRDEVHFTTLLWQNNGWQNCLKPRTLFSEFYKIVVNKVNFVGFRWGGAIGAIAPTWIRPWVKFIAGHASCPFFYCAMHMHKHIIRSQQVHKNAFAKIFLHVCKSEQQLEICKYPQRF